MKRTPTTTPRRDLVARLCVLLALAPAACQAQQPERAEPAERSDAPSNTLTEAEREAGWELLFDGETLTGWRGFRREGLPNGWAVEDGTLSRVGPGGDIINERQFEDFELRVEWKVGPAGNSGIFYLASEDARRIFESAPEMQVLDDAGHADGASPLTSAGSNYGLHPAPRGVVRPAGEWNEAGVVVRDGHVEHWLNGQLIVEYELGSEDWARRVAESKFTEWPTYGQVRRGHIGLQDHGDPVWFRNIKIREPR
jgi:hypothetical protein